jgi:hypothetical protein
MEDRILGEVLYPVRGPEIPILSFIKRHNCDLFNFTQPNLKLFIAPFKKFIHDQWIAPFGRKWTRDKQYRNNRLGGYGPLCQFKANLRIWHVDIPLSYREARTRVRVPHISAHKLSSCRYDCLIFPQMRSWPVLLHGGLLGAGTFIFVAINAMSNSRVAP